MIPLSSEKKITGIMFSYHVLCDRKLWFFAHNVQMEQTSELVELGNMIDTESFARKQKHVFVNDSICIDYLDHGIVYEVKKSKKEKRMAEAQIKYYLYHLKKSGVEEPIGILKVPSSKYTEEIYLSSDDEMWIDQELEKIRKIIESDKIPSVIDHSSCCKCAYFELCQI